MSLPEDSSSSSSVSTEFTSDRNRTQILVNSANIVDQADMQLLPAVYATLESSLGFSPIESSTITTSRSLLQALSTPIWGWFADNYSRNMLLAIGCYFWAFFTLLVALVSSYEWMFILRSLTGIGLAVLVPTANSLLSDYFPENERGKAFGLLGLTGVLGAIIGTLYATSIKDTTIIGIDGWRFAFITMAALSGTLGLAIMLLGKDPIRGESETTLTGLIDREIEKRYLITKEDYKKILKNKTFLLITLQGVAGLIPWSSILWIIAWFEYIGYDPTMAGLLFALIAMGAAAGNLVGGYLGDKAAKWNPDKGRIIVAQISVASGIPMMFVVFWFIPRSTDMLVIYLLIGMFTGVMISWCAPACNSPIFSELFEPEIRSTAFSIDRLFEGAAAASGTLLVAFFAEVFFGYIVPEAGTKIADLPAHIRETNIDAMANGLLIATVVPWFFCLLVYFLVYFTYPSDRERSRKALMLRKQEIMKLKQRNQ
ncbi:MAG: MFS transporter [Promethearchaeota archaeon]